MDILTFVNNEMQQPFFDAIVPIIYTITDAHILLILTIILLIVAWALKIDKIKKILLICVIAIFLTSIILGILKLSYISPRPYLTLSNIRLVVRDNGLNSFPSGHIAISMTIISVIIMKIKKHKPLLIILSLIYMVILTFSLLYSGVHYPIDLAVGAVVGIISAVVTVVLSNKYLYRFFNI
ncbi:phosphatase PAP2 family protein [uncultured Methanobrevibacter sp.]|uniref:phosphatase PAP2 family protein n=1 Tax=uncultured Methanobrevibacter sp. TaxID=253161 RepID=UPI0025E0955C|nr:phosphatase PAP2 family protein [uncultured Methanobrevibacter sp.]